MVARISENVEATKEQTDAVDDHLSVTKSGRDRFENGTSVGVGDLLVCRYTLGENRHSSRAPLLISLSTMGTAERKDQNIETYPVVASVTVGPPPWPNIITKIFETTPPLTCERYIPVLCPESRNQTTFAN